MKALRAHPVLVTVLAGLLAAGAMAAIAGAYGYGSCATAWDHLHVGWIAVVICGELLAYPAYTVAYRTLVSLGSGPRLRWPLALRIVAAGFGPFTPRGGFALDKRALHAIDGDEASAVVRVLGLGALEWALLAPAACITAIVLLVIGDVRTMPSLLWPWALAVPAGFVIAFWLAAPTRRTRVCRAGGRARPGLDRALRAIDMLRSLASGFSSCWLAWLAGALYWVFDIAAFYGAGRFVGLHVTLGETILAYATGYALTRRSMPLGGAGVTEALMTFALHWVGEPVAAALAAVLVYRVFNFGLPALLALIVRPRVHPLLTAADRGRVPAREARRRAAAPLSS